MARYEKVLNIQGPVDDASYGAAQCLEKIGKFTNDQGKVEQSHRQFEALASKTPPYPKALLKLVEVYYWKGDYAGMREVALKAVKLLPNDFTAAYQLGEAYRFNEKYDKAYQEYDRAEKLAFQEGVLAKYLIPLQFNMADSLFWQGDVSGAYKLLSTVVHRIGPDSMVEWDRLVIMCKALASKRVGNYYEEVYQKLHDRFLSIVLEKETDLQKQASIQKGIDELYAKWKKQVKRK